MGTPTAIAVLHLEDSDLDAELIGTRLERSGLQLAVDRVTDRAAFEARLAGHRYDLILSDFQVPGFDGFDALDLATRHQPGVPFIFLSGALGEEVAVETLRRGATDYILKERLARLVPAVERALAEARERAARRQAEEERERLLGVLAQRGEELRLVTDAVPVLIAYLDAGGVYRFANRGYEVWFGRPREQVVGRHLAEVLGAAAYEVIRPNVERVQRGEQHEFETFAPYRDGGGRHVHVNYVPRFEGDRVVGFYALVADITDRRRAEDMARFVAGVSNALAELTDSVSTMQKVAGLSVPTFADWCAVDMVDDGGERRRVAVTHADPVKLRAYRDLIERYPPRAGDPHGTCEVLRTGAPDLLEDIPESVLIGTAHDDGHLRQLREMGLRSQLLVPIRSRGRTLGAITFLTAESGRRYTPADLGVARDLADRAAVAIHNAELYHALQDADRRKDEFLATLAHELRNPLAPIRTGLQLLRMADASGRAEHARAMMERQATQLARLVDDLMDVSRISRGKMELIKERVGLAAVVGSAVETSRPLIDHMGHDLRVDLPTRPVWLDADPTRLAQVFMNLLNNAAKYSDRGGRIRLAAEVRGDEVEVVVRDRGIGIPLDKLGSIFDLFSQVDRSLEKSQGGLGIGLSLVRRLVEMHGGTVEARSSGPGQGAEFVVRLPVATGPAEATLAAAGGDDRSPRSALRVLIADDNRDGADSLADMLVLMGNDTRTAYDGEEAVRGAVAFRPDVVLLDIGMPKLNGHDTCRRIRELPWGGAVVLIALTGWGQQEDVRRSRDAGFDHHLVKPVDPVALMKLLSGLSPRT